jgi:glycosyltransferase involved in cell wall biosynthesis
MSKKFNRVLYVGGMHKEGSSWSRYKAIKKKCECVDVLEIRSSHSFLKKLEVRLLRSATGKKDIQFRRLVETKHYDLIWVDKPNMISTTCLRSAIESNPDTVFIAHITDDIKTMNIYAPEMVANLALFHKVFSCNEFNIEEFPQIPLIYNELGFDHEHYKFSAREKLVSRKTIGFVGHYEKHYANTILRLADSLVGSDFTISVNGSGWWKCPKIWLHQNTKVRNGWIDFSELLTVYKGSVSAIGLYSADNRNQTSGRIFELAALGVPLITQGNGVIDEYVGSNYLDLNSTTMIDNLPQILSDPQFLEKLAKRAFDHLVDKRCSWEDRINQAFEKL